MNMKDKFVYLIKAFSIAIVSVAIAFAIWFGMSKICMFFGMDEGAALILSIFLSWGLSIFVPSILPIFKNFKQYRHLEKNTVYAIISLTADTIRLFIKTFLKMIAFIIGGIIGCIALLGGAFIIMGIHDYLLLPLIKLIKPWFSVVGELIDKCANSEFSSLALAFVVLISILIILIRLLIKQFKKTGKQPVKLP